MTDFHVVERTVGEEADILKDVSVTDMPWAVYRRCDDKPELKLGILIAPFWSEDMAIVTCKAMNACGDFIRTMMED